MRKRHVDKVGMDFLQEYCLVALDVFRQNPYSEDRNEQTAWLSFLTTETLEDAERLMNKYPWLEDIYKEIAMLRQKPGEVLHMFSEALKIMDRNTVNYMIEEQQKELEEQQKELEKQLKKLDKQQEELDMRQKKLKNQQERLESQKEQLESQQEKLESQKEQLESQQEKLESQKEQLVNQQEQLEQKDKQLQEKDQEILALKKQLEELQSKG